MTVALQEFRLPFMASMETARIVEWHQNVGDTVADGDPFVDIETEKASTEVPIDLDGVVLALLAEVDEDVRLGDVVALIGPVGTDPASPDVTAALEVRASASTEECSAPTPPTAEESELAPAPISAPASGGTKAPPAVKQLAREHGIDLATVTPTGPGGRISRDDVLRAAGVGGDASGA